MMMEESALLKELAARGFAVSSVSELFGRKLEYRDAVPILLDWLPRVTSRSLKEEIVRALSVKWAKPTAAPQLVREFESAEDPSGLGLRWAIANALSIVADDDVFEDVARLAMDATYGRSREMLAVALGNMKDERADAVLIKLLDDEQIVGHALIAAGKRRIQGARGKVQALLHHPKAWVQKEAKKTLTRLG